MKVLIADAFEAAGVDRLKAAGCDVVHRPDVEGDALAWAIRDEGAEVLIVRGTKVTAAMLDANALALIVRAGAGYNTIDVAAASARGIYVANCPGSNAIAVAELAFGLILALDRRIPDNVRDLRAGVWNKKEYSKAAGLFGRTLGLLGYGAIGQATAERARGFGMPVVVWSRRFTGGARAVPAAAQDVDASLANAHIADVQIARSPQEVAEFLQDDRPDAYERLVDRMLLSPHYGEKWARHWLDLVRYAETRGHEFDYPVPNAHHYRDYVIRAINADVPYDRFVAEHIAGDLLPNPRRHPADGFDESILGTGFWLFGDMVHSVAEIIAYASSVFTLLPGDVILTGTPAGVGPLVEGDTVEVTVSGLGTLSNPVRAAG